MYDRLMEDGQARRLLVAQLSGTAARYARKHLGHADGIAELQATSDDPDVLAETAAQYVASRSAGGWYYGDAVQLLLDAGADPDMVGEYVERRQRQVATSFNLGAFADGINHLGGNPGG